MKMWELLNFREKFRSLKPQEGCAIHAAQGCMQSDLILKKRRMVFLFLFAFFFTIMSHKNTELHKTFSNKIQVT